MALLVYFLLIFQKLLSAAKVQPKFKSKPTTISA